ncbi:MAG: hypothetical protein C0501_03160 [Isosphaera sp.]|nr:hypothetical protein [Isosphaera sp.]
MPPGQVPPGNPKGGKTSDTDPRQFTVLPDPSQIFVLRDDAQTARYAVESLRRAEFERVALEEQKRVKEVADLRAKGMEVPPKLLVPLDPTAQSLQRYPRDLQFPAIELAGAGGAYVPKTVNYPPAEARFEARYVVHRRLHFEEKNAERYGWDLGFIQPLVSTLYFYRDVLLLPNSLASGLAYGFWDTNAGKCLPGSPTPYLFYPPGLTITGTAAEGVVITGLSFAFP